VYDIVINHLTAHLDNCQPRQTPMIIIGQAGTGKSTLLNTITQTFEKLDASHLLAKTAMTGVAASLIGGTTLHLFAGLPVTVTPQSDIWPDNSNKCIKQHRDKNLGTPLWIAINEAGMCTLDLLTLISHVTGKARVNDSSANSTVPFGGLNIILIADFHQFPPVGGQNVALYWNPTSRNTATVGKAIYLQFETVIILRQQWRMVDQGWIEILQRCREGDCSAEDLEEIRKLVITHPQCKLPDFICDPSNNAILITPRNCVHAAWNRACLQKHCKHTGNLLYVFDAEDTTGPERLRTTIEQNVMIASMKVTCTACLPYRVEVAIGMQVMITLNVATEADLVEWAIAVHGMYESP
jgi:PIF1-like helicase